MNVSEGRDVAVLDALADACGAPLLDAHADPDHHRSVFTMAAAHASDLERAVRRLALAAATAVDLHAHDGVHPRAGAVDVVPFVPLRGTPAERDLAVRAALRYAHWSARRLHVPVHLYGDAHPAGRPLPAARRDAAAGVPPDVGGPDPTPPSA